MDSTYKTSDGTVLRGASRSSDASAGPLVGGLVALLLAGACIVIAQAQAAGSYDGSGGTGWLVVAGLLALGGSVFFLVGLYVLATHIDNLARAQRNQPTA